MRTRSHVKGILEGLITKDPRIVALEQNVSLKYVTNVKAKYKANDATAIFEALRSFEEKFEEIDYVALYKKREECIPEQFHFHCHTCGISIGEKDPEKIIEHVTRHMTAHPKKYLTQQIL